MAISEFEIKRCEQEAEKFLALKRPPLHVRSQIDYGYRIEDQSVEFFAIRPNMSNPENRLELPFAKATFVKKEKHWKIYWQRQDLKWHSYKPAATVQFFEEFIAIVNQDAHACFFG